MVGTCSAVPAAPGASQLWPANSNEVDTCGDTTGTDNRVTPSEEAAQRPTQNTSSTGNQTEQPATKRQRTAREARPPSASAQRNPETDADRPAASQAPSAAASPPPSNQDEAAPSDPAAAAAVAESLPDDTRETDATVLLQQYAELLSSPHPQYVLQALNLLLAISRRDGHAQVLAHNPALVKALCSVVHAFHLVIDAALAQRAAPADAAAAAPPLQDVRRALVEGPWCGEACEAQAWRAQLAVHAGTVIHNLVQVAHELMSAESLSALHALCLRHLPLLHSQPCPSVLELAALLLNVTRATVRAMPTPSLLTMCDSVLPLVLDSALPLQIKAVAASTLAEALSSRQGVYLARHLSTRRPREPFAAAHSLILSTHADGEHAYTVQRRGEAGPAGLSGEPPEGPQARLAAQYMPRFWHMHAISCGIRLARELLAAVAAGYVSVATAGAAGPSGERVSRTLQLRLPLMPSSAPASPTVRVGGPQHSAGRPAARAGGPAEDRAESMGLWDLSPAVSTPASPAARAGADRGLRPAWSVAARAEALQSAAPRKSDSGSPQARAADVRDKLRRHVASQGGAEDEPRAAQGGSDAGARATASPGTSGGAPEAAVAAGPVGDGVDTAGAAAADAPAAVAPQESTCATAPAQAAASDADRSLTLAPLPALLMHGGRMPEGIWDLPKAGAPDAGPSPLGDPLPGSPSLDHMPSFSRWVSMSLSCSVSFGGPVRAEQEVRSRRIAAPVAAEQDAVAERAESECSHPPPSKAARGDGGGSHTPISLAPPPSLPMLQSGRSPLLGRGVDVPPLDLAAGVCGSSSWLPEASAFGTRGSDLWAQTSDVLHVPALLMAALCDVATGGRPGAPPGTAALMPPPSDAVAVGADSTSPQQAAAAAPAGAEAPPRAVPAASTEAAPDPAPPAQGEGQEEAAAPDAAAEAVADAPPAAPALEGVPPAGVDDGAALQGLVMTMDREVIRGAHEALAVALRVPELTPQVSARQGELLNAMFEDREESTPRRHLTHAQ